MYKPMIAALALVAATLPASAGQPQDDDTITTLFAKALEAYREQGYKPTGWEQKGKLAAKGEQLFKVTLTGGSSFQLVGVCDNDCDDLDIQLLDSAGKEVDKDDKKDDFPIVGTTSAGTYQARVTMVACKTDRCAFGVKAFVQGD